MRLRYCFFSLLIILICACPLCFSHFAAPPQTIHEYVEKSDFVVIGTVVKYFSVMKSPTGHEPNLNLFIGSLHSVRVDKVLYGDREINQHIFATDSLKRINRILESNTKKKPMFISAFHQKGLAFGIGMPSYTRNQPRLFYFKVSKFPTDFPESTLISDPSIEYDSISQIRTITSLKERFYFEATTDTIDSTWNLKSKHKEELLPIVEALGQAMSIRNQSKKEHSLRRLCDSKDLLLAENARRALLNIRRTKKKQTRSEVVSH